MKITYPPLVEQAYNSMLNIGRTDLTKQDIYIISTELGLIDENCNPTKKLEAIKQVIVEKLNDAINNHEPYLIRMFCNSVLANPDSTPKEIQKARATLDKIKDWS